MRTEQLAKATDAATESILRIADIFELDHEERLSFLRVLSAATIHAHDVIAGRAQVRAAQPRSTYDRQNHSRS